MKNAVGWRPPFPSITTTEASLSARGSHKTRARGGGGARREPERASLPSALRESDPVAGAARLDPRDALFRPARPREISRPLPRGNDVRHPVSAMASAPQHLGAYRNLTDKFVRYRERARQTFGLGGASSPRAREAASTRLLEAAIGSSSSMGLGGEEGAGLDGLSASLPPAWVDFSDEAQGDIVLIKEKMKELAAAHSKALLPNFDDAATEGEDRVVEVLTQDITRLVKRCEGRLLRRGDGGGGASKRGKQDDRVVKNVQRKLATELTRLSQVFRKSQKEYLRRLKQQNDRGPGAAGVDDVFGFAASGSGSGGGGWGDDGGGASGRDAYDPGFTEQQLQRVDRSEAMTFERDAEVVKILESVNDLAGVMKDLSVLVIDQGTILDRIDYNLEQVSATVEEGRKQLTKAEKHQKNSRMIICIYFLMVAVAVMLVIVVIQKM